MVLHHHVSCDLVEGGHQSVGESQGLRGRHLRLGGRGQDADAERLREEQHVPGPGAGVGQHLLRMDEARDSETVLGLLVQDAVAPGDESPGLIDLVVSAPQELVHRLLGHVRRDGHDVQAQLRLAPHGVDIAEGVGGGDLPEEVGIVRDGREEVHRLHQSQVVCDLVDAGVVALVKAHQQPRVLADPDALQELGQHPGPHLGPAAGALRKLREFHLVFRHGLPPFLRQCGGYPFPSAPPSGRGWLPARRRPRPGPCRWP